MATLQKAAASKGKPSAHRTRTVKGWPIQTLLNGSPNSTTASRSPRTRRPRPFR